ncbi:MAG: hypothetical protein IKN17_05835 [Ruminococcus sp.]|nr:hypothetical protein [Ruminococcus sp.]
METAVIGIGISLLSLAVAAIVGFTNLRRSKTSDDRRDAAEMTTVIVKLESISTGITEIKSDMRNLQTSQQELRDRLIICEQSTKSAHHRIDKIEGKDKE